MSIQEGKKALAFTAIDQDGEKIKLADFKGKKLALYFYPKDDTSTCTVQACNLRDHYKNLLKKGYIVLGVSPDSSQSHQKFIAKHELPFPLLVDTEHKIAEAFGVWGEKKMYGRTYQGIHRTTFIIDEKGKIERIIDKPKSSVHAQEILES
mgnify:CR=1 FL=1